MGEKEEEEEIGRSMKINKEKKDKNQGKEEENHGLKEKVYIAKRRFKEFSQLDTDIRSLYREHQLYSNLPSLPPLYNTLSVDHTDSAFLAERQIALEQYLAKLLRIPHATSSPDLIFFLIKSNSKYVDPFTRPLHTTTTMSDNESIYDILDRGAWRG